jgi:hypothetical protein
MRVGWKAAHNPVRTRPQPYAMTFAPRGRTLYVVDYTADDGPGYTTPDRTCARRWLPAGVHQGRRRSGLPEVDRYGN